MTDNAIALSSLQTKSDRIYALHPKVPVVVGWQRQYFWYIL
ncbi:MULTISPECIES: hypothetical protein [Nostocales]|nr:MULTISPECIES: hypothetical protein [Nostocales]